MKILLDTLKAILGSMILLVIILCIAAFLDSVLIAYLGIAFFFITNLFVILSPLFHKMS